MKILRPGLLTTVQDLGRRGLQQLGIGPGGAMDDVSLRVANILVGNAASAAGLEITLRGPTIQFPHDALIAICGANLSAAIRGRRLPLWRPVAVSFGTVLNFDEPMSGCRAYLAIAGGISVPEVLGSRSTHLRARFGGFDGRALRAGDELATGSASAAAQRLLQRLSVQPGGFASVDWSVNTRRFTGDASGLARVIPGTHFDRFSLASRQLLYDSAFRVTAQSDRMGYRLDGPALDLGSREEMVSEPVSTGAIQVPPEGQPIVLMVDRQTIGGYPRIAHVITVDVPLMAQLKPGDRVQFTEVSLDEAQRLYQVRQMELDQITTDVRKELEKP